MKCHICEKEFTISEQGIANHTSDSGEFDFDADGDHVPYELESDEEEVDVHPSVNNGSIAWPLK